MALGLLGTEQRMMRAHGHTVRHGERMGSAELCSLGAASLGFPSRKHGVCLTPQSYSRRSDNLDKVTEEVRRETKRGHGPSEASQPCALTTVVLFLTSHFIL